MRVLLTHELYPPDLAGGGEHVVEQTALGLARLGIGARVLTTGDPAVASHGGITTLRLPMSKYRMNLAVARIIEEARDADVIQTFSYHACLPSLLAARRLRKPVVMVCLGLFGDAWLRMRGPAIGRCWRAWERFLITRPYDRTVFISDYSRREGLRLGVDPSRSIVNLPGVEAGEFHPRREKENAVLFVGKLSSRKGVDLVLEAARALPHIPFRVVGWGPEASFYRAQAPANVQFAAMPEGKGLWSEFERASIFFLPSRAETFGMALLQAMAGGCAVISTIDLPFEGVSVSVDELPRMIAAIESLWNNPEDSRRMGLANAARAREYTWSRFCTRLADLYGELSGRAPELHAALQGREPE